MLRMLALGRGIHSQSFCKAVCCRHQLSKTLPIPEHPGIVLAAGGQIGAALVSCFSKESGSNLVFVAQLDESCPKPCAEFGVETALLPQSRVHACPSNRF